LTLDRQKLKEKIHELYRFEHDEMGERGTLERLERGRESSSSFPTPACWTAGIRSRPRSTAVSTAAPIA
jgi:hypothetical protein